MRLLRNTRLMVGLGVLLVAAVVWSVWAFRPRTTEVTRVEFERLLAANALVSARITPTPYAGFYEVEANRRAAGGAARIHIATYLDHEQVHALLGLSGVKVDLPDGGAKGRWIDFVGTLALGGLVLGFVAYQTNLGRGRNSRIRQRPKVTFADVAGIDEAKAEVQEIVDFLREPKKYHRLGGRLPKGVLLIGPPGTGKTLLAKAIACEAKANFFSAHGSDFTEVFVGVGAKRVRHLFRQAARHKPAILFIDEIDCVGKNRKFDTHAEHQQTINALLAAMDGFESSGGVVVIAATNRPEDLDEALLRPGRFDRKVHVPYPDVQGRRAILRAHAHGRPIANADQALDALAQTTPGMSGADLANLLNEAAIFAALQNDAQITLAALEAARDKVRYGKERKSMVVNRREREMVAVHEAGHTIIHLATRLLPRLYKVSIVPRGTALGVTTLLPEEDQHLQTKPLLLEQLLVLMGGRAAEKTFFGATTNGAAGDLDSARNLARKMVHEWGMGEKLYYEPEQPQAEAEINRLLAEADRQALALVQERKGATQEVARALLERETLSREEVLAIAGPPDHLAGAALAGAGLAGSI